MVFNNEFVCGSGAHRYGQLPNDASAVDVRGALVQTDVSLSSVALEARLF